MQTGLRARTELYCTILWWGDIGLYGEIYTDTKGYIRMYMEIWIYVYMDTGIHRLACLWRCGQEPWLGVGKRGRVRRKTCWVRKDASEMTGQIYGAIYIHVYIHVYKA